MLTKALEVTKYVKASAGRVNLGVVFEDVNQPRHDGNTIYLPHITKDTTEKELLNMMASTDHEVAHDRFTDFNLLEEKNIDTTTPFGMLFNVIEDNRVNAIEALEYEGFRQIWDQSASDISQKIISNIGTHSKLPPTAELMMAAMVWESQTISDLFPTNAVVTSSFTPNEDIFKVLEKFNDRLKDLRYKNNKVDSAVAYDLARDIWRALGGDPDEEERKNKERRTKKGGEEGKEDEAASSSGSSSSGEGDSDKDAPPGEDKWEIIKCKSDPVSKRLVETLIKDRMSKTGIHMDTRTKYPSTWSLTPFDQFAVVDYTKHTSTGHSYLQELLSDRGGATHFINRYKYRSKDLISAENFVTQVRKLIQIRSHARTEYGVKKGKLDQARISRLCTKVPGFSERIFKHKIVNDTLDVACTVLMDMSGSMSGDKAIYSCMSGVLLCDTFKVLGIPLELLGFTDVGSGEPLMYVYKSFQTPNLGGETFLDSFAKSSVFMNGNPDGENILWAHNRLIQRKEKRKVLFVLSDGSPAASKCADGVDEFTFDVIKEIEKSKTVDIYGVGLLHEGVKEYYKHYSVISNVAEIPTKLIEAMERKVFHV